MCISSFFSSFSCSVSWRGFPRLAVKLAEGQPTYDIPSSLRARPGHSVRTGMYALLEKEKYAKGKLKLHSNPRFGQPSFDFDVIKNIGFMV